MSLEIIIPIAAAIVLIMLFSWSIAVFKLTVKTLLPVVAILLLLQVGLGIDSRDIIQEMVQIVKSIQQLISETIIN